MAYEKQNFKGGNILKAEQLNHMEDGIAKLETSMITAEDPADTEDVQSSVESILAKIKTLYQNGQQIMPVTHPKAVMDDDGETLEAKLSKINKRLEACGNGGSMSGQLVGSASGTSVSVSDALAAPLMGLRVWGKSTQDGVPTPTAPVPIVSAGDGGTVTVRLTGENLLNPSLFQDGQYQNFDNASANYGIAANDNYWITGLQPCVTGNGISRQPRLRRWMLL